MSIILMIMRLMRIIKKLSMPKGSARLMHDISDLKDLKAVAISSGDNI